MNFRQRIEQMTAKTVKLTIDAWPVLIEELEKLSMLGSTPAEVARFLIIEGIEQRRLGKAAYRGARAAAIASGWRGDI